MEHYNKINEMAQLSQLAYKNKNVKSQFTNLGYTGHKYFNIDGAQCYAVWNDKTYCLCFRGTEPTELSDLFADLKAWPKGAMTHGLVHAGFKTELDKLWKDLVKHQSKHKDKKFYITGHSLGAAMATIATSRFEEDTEVSCLTTFGSPRVGTRSFVKNITTPHHRVVNNNDIVTRVPLFLMGYKHHGNLVYINFYGQIRKMTLWQRFKDKCRGRWAAMKKLHPFDGTQDHGMNYYIDFTKGC